MRCGLRNHGAKFGVVTWSTECKKCRSNDYNICFMAGPAWANGNHRRGSNGHFFASHSPKYYCKKCAMTQALHTAAADFLKRGDSTSPIVRSGGQFAQFVTQGTRQADGAASSCIPCAALGCSTSNEISHAPGQPIRCATRGHDLEVRSSPVERHDTIHSRGDRRREITTKEA